ncbi:urease accessory protein UreD [Myroides sp. LJL119]
MVCSLDVLIQLRKDGYSFLKDAYVTPPFRIVPVGQYKKDKAAYLMIMSTSPGLLDGDDHQISVTLEPDCILQLQTQSYQRLYHMQDKSMQTTKVYMQKGSKFSYVPHPIVPQNSSFFISKNMFYMQDDAHLAFSDIITCGRKGSGEEFEYNHFQNLTEIYHNNKLVVKDNVLLKPKEMPIQDIGLLEGYTHQGTFIYYNTAGIPVDQLQEQFYNRYGDLSQIEFGISSLQGDGFMIRVLGQGAEQIFTIFKEVQQKLWEELFVD